MANRLAHATSPYLIQHADNPVDWWPWCDEAFDEAVRRDVPVFVSIGYAACHWCHVMAHESFEDERVAAYLNSHFVSIKVDREERPDVDATYMAATVATTGQGGWPMSVFINHERRPFYAGTYFPPTNRSGMPGFGFVLEAISDAWRDRRDAIDESADKVMALISARPDAAPGPVTDSASRAAVARLTEQFDAQHGGFGGAPKFPQPMVYEFLLRHHARTGDHTSSRMVEKSLTAMARGGLYDQVGGGFARYSVDREWIVPHFEKMLYDNALLLRAYLHWWRADRFPLAHRIVTETAEFLLREMLTPEGAFAASLDADTDGVEGAFYVWTPDQLSALGLDPADLAVTEAGTFERGTSVLQMPHELGPDWAGQRERLRAAREDRTRPARDDKVVTSWNAWAISALAEAAVLFDEPRWLAVARRALNFVTSVHWNGQRVIRASRDGSPGRANGVLEDYASLASAVFTVAACDGSDPGLGHAIVSAMIDQFLTDGVRESLATDVPGIPADPVDNATPSGWTTASEALLTAATLTGDGAMREKAENLIAQGIGRAGHHPVFFGHGWSVAEAMLAGPLEVAVLDDPGGPMHRAALEGAAAGTVVALSGPLLDGRRRVGGLPTAFVCRGFVCELPTTDVTELVSRLSGR